MQEQPAVDTSFLPRNAGRAQSMISNGKPVHPHRVIKDRANSMIAVTGMSEKRPALVPLPAANVDSRGSIDACIQGGPSALLKLEKNPGLENDTKEFLRRRIKELEKEVLKLNNHIHQAELSIKNYRVSLSEKSPRVGFSPGKECSVQTDPDDTSVLQASLKSAQEKLTVTVEELRGVKAAKDAMFQERKQLQEANKRKEEYMVSTAQANEDTISKQAARIRELEAQLQSAQSGAAVSAGAAAPPAQHSDHLLESLLGTLTETQRLRQDLKTIRGRVASDSAALFTALTADYLAMLQKAQEVQAAGEKAPMVDPSAERVAELTLLHTNACAELEQSKGQLLVLRTECDRLVTENTGLHAKITNMVRVTEDRCTNTEPGRTMCDASTSTPTGSPLSTPAKAVLPPLAEASVQMMDACASPLSPLANRSYNAAAASAAAAIQADQQIQAKLRLAEKDAELAQLQARIEKDRALLRQQSDDLDGLRQRLLSERERFDKICIEQEQQLAQRTTQCMNHQLRADSFQQRLGSATQALQGLQEVHQAELKAVRHEAHIKDLLRVAKEREADIEKDRLQIELKHIKEVQGILTFSLSTAEQSLNDVLPHVVVKLAQGREKRLKLLEQTTNGRRRDLDQRSADTCAVNSAHLDGFQKKAATNNAMAKEMTHAAVKKLMSILQPEAPPVGAGGSAMSASGSNTRLLS